jgi:hypothetical protein
MIVKPRALGPDGIYFPYINADTNVLNLNENNKLKGNMIRDITRKDQIFCIIVLVLY